MHAILSPIKAINGLVLMPGAVAKVIAKGEHSALLQVKLTSRSADSLQIRVDLQDLTKIALPQPSLAL